MKGEHNLLEWACMLMPPQVIYESRIFTITLGALTIGDSGGLRNALVSAKIVDKSDKPFVENGEFFV